MDVRVEPREQDDIRHALGRFDSDLPAPGDYDGDGKQDLAIWRPSDGNWWVFASTAGIYSQPFGLTGDIRTPNAFVY